MPRNSSGTYSLPQAPFVAGTTISSAAVNSNFSDISTALTDSLSRNGAGGMAGQLKVTDGTAAAPAITFTSDLSTGFYKPGTNQVALSIAGVQALLFTSSGISGLMAPGVVCDYAGATAPTQWLLCYGQAVSRTTYPLLFAVIGTIYGNGDGVNTFNVPDLRGVTIYGKDDMGGAASGRINSTYYGASVTALGAFGGGQLTQLGIAEMASYVPSGVVTIFDGGHAHNYTAPALGPGTGTSPNYFLSGATTGTTTASTSNISAGFSGAGNGGSSAPFSRLSSGSILNKIIFAGAS